MTGIQINRKEAKDRAGLPACKRLSAECIMTLGRSQGPRATWEPWQGYISDPFPGISVSSFTLLSPFLMLSVCLYLDCCSEM